MKEDMLIVLKLLYAWLLPPGIFLLAIAAMYGYYRKAKYAKGLMLLFALIYLLSISAVSDKVIQPLEDQYAQPSVSELKDAQAIVVLAGGSYDGVPDFDGNGQNSESSTVRLVAGLRLHRVLHLPIVLSGVVACQMMWLQKQVCAVPYFHCDERVFGAAGGEAWVAVRENKECVKSMYRCCFLQCICCLYSI